MSRPISFMKTPAQFLDGSKDVTRRGGPKGPAWKTARPGNVLHAWEWSRRWNHCYQGEWISGGRWVCGCGFLGGISPGLLHTQRCPRCGSCRAFDLAYRGPRDFGEIIILEAGQGRLGDISPREVLREGFAEGVTTVGFVRRYSGSYTENAQGLSQREFDRRTDLYIAATDWTVTRLVFARIIDGKVQRQKITRELGEWDGIDGLTVADAREFIWDTYEAGR